MIDMVWQRQAIPAKLKLGMFYAEGNCGNWLSYQGAQVFSLRRATISALEAQGISFFDDIDRPVKQASHSYFVGDWQETPVPGAENSGDGPLSNMFCAMGHSWTWPEGLPEAMQQKGGFYETAGGRTLVVLPRQGYVVAIASDR